MPRSKRTSNSVDNLKERLSGMISINPKLDLGNGITIEEGQKLVTTCESSLQDYNVTLSVADEKQFAIEKLEKEIDTFCAKILSSVAVRYGKDSIEYEKVGGKRTSDIKRAPKKPKSSTAQQ